MYNFNIKILKILIVLLVIFFVWMGIAIKARSSNMAEPTWGALEKSGVNPETIEEAIVRLIQTHDDDALSHGDAAQSIGVHKTQGVIDHPELSIVHDKLAPYSIDLNQFVANEYMIFTNFESIDGWNGVEPGVGGRVFAGILETELRTGFTANDYVALATESQAGQYVINFAKKISFQTPVRLTDVADVNALIIAGITKYFGFKITNNTLEAVHHNGATETTTNIAGITLTNYNVFKAIFDPTAGEIYFYVNEVLKATHVSNLPTGDDAFIFQYYIINPAGGWRRLWVRNLLLTAER